MLPNVYSSPEHQFLHFLCNALCIVPALILKGLSVDALARVVREARPARTPNT